MTTTSTSARINRGKALRPWLSFLARAGITVLAFWWILRQVDLDILLQVLRQASWTWLWVSVGIFLFDQFLCIARWRFLAPEHPSVTWPFLTRSYFVAAFFNTLLPTTVGGDVVRGYDLIKATGEWRISLASVLLDRLLGLLGFLAFALIAWAAFPPAREDPIVRAAFAGFCLLVVVTFSVLGSRRVLRAMLRPFARIGLGALESHAKQFQESLLAYRRQPQRLLSAFVVTLAVQVAVILMFAAVSQALRLPIPLLFLMLIVPIIIAISQLPLSLNGWGIREGAAILFLGRLQIGREEALAFSLVCAVIPVASAVVGALFFLGRRRKKR